METLTNKSGILVLKSKFFIYRALTYFSFLLLPIWMGKALTLSLPLQILVMVLYCTFIMSQWFLLGKEIDHRLKIYFRVNSSIDRVVYRVFMGMFFMTIFFNLLYLLPHKWIYNSFWATWVSLGLFYSWPTRGKIIQESVTSNFNEYRYLDRFEKTVLFLVIVLFIVSIPEFPKLDSFNSLKLYFDPNERVAGAFWNFITVNYYPFMKYPKLLKIAWCVHFYFLTMVIFLAAFYATARYFVSRRLAILAGFALVSTWSFTKVMAYNYGTTLITTYSVLWVWTTLWCTKSSTYRSGLFVGLVGAWGVIIDKTNLIIFIIQLALIFTYFFRDKTNWYKKQFFRYCSFGIFISFLSFVLSTSHSDFSPNLNLNFLSTGWGFIERKAFFVMSFFGILLLSLKTLYQKANRFDLGTFEQEKLNQFVISIASLFFLSTLVESRFVEDFSMIWILVMMSVLPIEVIFQKIRGLRSRRNMIYMIYIIICLLDSHFEGRLKIIYRMVQGNY
ncbi:MAG: hypothetical protein CME69_00650 [Halobacteriovorax sp.]|nr:hypothetical protein [Halobacteriovorax sp.]